MGDDLPGERVVHVANPAALFALALAHRADLARLLHLLAAGIEAAAHHALIASVAQVARPFAHDMHDGGNRHAQVDAHDP